MFHSYCRIALIGLLPLCSCSPEPSLPPQPIESKANETSPSATETESSTASTKASSQLITVDGIGNVRVGSAPEQVSDPSLRFDDALDGPCRIYVAEGQPGLYALVEDGVIKRVTVHDDRVGRSAAKTERGIGVGSTEAQVRAAYAPLEERPHEYLAPLGKNLYFGTGPSRLRFEIDDERRVSAIHAGVDPQLEYAEGCA